MTKEELKEGFHQGFSLDDMLTLIPGQDCMIFKADKFRTDDEVIYIPDMCLNEITAYRTPDPEEYDYILSNCYTGRDFIDEAGGNEALAYRLFCYCDWQHPSSAINEVDCGEEE